MNKSKARPRPQKRPESDFARMAMKAMRQAQREAARENARYGMRLILQKDP